MVYNNFDDLKLSRMGMGNMRLPTIGEGFHAPVDYAEAQKIIDYALDNGVNYFGTAFDYHGGDSEAFIGQAFGKHPRNSYHIATKYFILANPDYKEVFETQFKRLNVEYIDFYLIHGIFDHTFRQYMDNGCIEYLQEQKDKGKIKYFGFSSHASIENLATFANRHKWDFAQIQLNPYDWVYGSAKQMYELLKNMEIPIIAMSPVRGGLLTSLSKDAEAMLKEAQPSWSAAEWALRWVKGLSNVLIALSGISSMDDIKENTRIFSDDISLSEAEEQLLYKAYEVFRDEVTLPCTACKYCIESDTCSVDINIPKVLEIYNSVKVDGFWGLRELDNIETKGRPIDCTACGACNRRCPQGIDIAACIGELAEMAKGMPARD